MYDFTTVKPDRNTDCTVYQRLDELGIKQQDAIPFAVAEMMFPVAPPILKALHRTADNAYFGYRQNEMSFREAICKWMAEKGVSVKPEQIATTHGVVAALGSAVRAFSEAGDSVLIQPPVYGPFFDVIKNNGRRLVENPLAFKNGRYEMDFEDLEAKLRSQNIKLMILCSPHNPVGRVWERETLERLHGLCARYGAQVLADEIHQDILPFGAKQTPYALIDPLCISFSAASKTFNIAGLSQAYAYSADKGKLERFIECAQRDAAELFNPFGMAATAAAYEDCGDWMKEMLAVVAENIEFAREFIGKRLPKLQMARPEGTYLCWVDMRGLGLTQKDTDALLQRAGMEVTPGCFFGTQGKSFVRLNVACPKRCLEAALLRLENEIRCI